MYNCDRCERSFLRRGSYQRHVNKRKNICRKPVYECETCRKRYTSKESKIKHQKMYCRDHDPVKIYDRKVKEMFDEIGREYTPLQVEDEHDIGLLEQQPKQEPNRSNSEIPEQQLDGLCNNNNNNNNILEQVSDAVKEWLADVIDINGKEEEWCNKIDTKLQYMLLDGLLHQDDYGKMKYTYDVCIRLQKTIKVYFQDPERYKRSMLKVLVELLQLGRINDVAFVEVCMNI